MSKWINVSEKLPVNGAKVLAVHNAEIYIVYFIEEHWLTMMGFDITSEIDWWMKLPELPNE